MPITVNQLLDWFDRDIDAGCAEHSEIRAILEQHRDEPPQAEVVAWQVQQIQLEAIRAFVERVNRRMDAMIEGYQGAENTPKDKVPSFKRCFNEEYEATMGEEDAGTND